MNDIPLELFDPRLGQSALRVEPLDALVIPGRPHRSNYFTVLWVRRGSGTFWLDRKLGALEDAEAPGDRATIRG